MVLNGSVRARLTSSVESGEPARGLPGSRTISSTAGVARTSVVAANPASGLIVEVVIRGRARTVILRAHAPTIGPFCSDACSMFARTSRYAPSVRGTRRSPQTRAAVQNGRSRHVPASLGTVAEIKIEPSSGLLIRGFGVQVPGGAPVLTWGFTAPGLFPCVRSVPMFAPCLLARTDPAIRGLSKAGHPAPDAEAFAAKPRRLVRPTPPRTHWTNGLDLPRWHREHTRSLYGDAVTLSATCW